MIASAVLPAVTGYAHDEARPRLELVRRRPPAPGGAGDDCYWIEPGTGQAYPLAFRSYRKVREAQEKRPARHCTLGLEVERDVCRRWRRPSAAEVEVRLIVRSGTSPRLRRIVAEVLRAIRRGRAVDDAIRRVARRFGLRQAHARTCLTGCLEFELRAEGEVAS